MRRRDFLAASAGLAGVAISRAGAEPAAPCPPPSLQIQGGASVASTCIGPGTAPQWFASQASGTWLPIAGPGAKVGAGGTLDAVRPPQAILDTMASSAGSSMYTAHGSLTTAWTGACVDQSRKEYLMVANGGHADYAGNEAYALRLTLEQPKWVRLNDPTPVIDTNAVLAFSPAVFADGRSKAMHTSGYQNYINGQVWFAVQNSATSGAGGTSLCTVSFNRNMFSDAIPPDQGGKAPVAYAGSANPWTTNYGPIGKLAEGSTDGRHFGLSAVDTLTGDIWTCGTSSTNREYFRVRTSKFSTDRFLNADFWSGAPYAFMACASDLRLLIVGIWAQNVIYVKRLDDDAQGFKQIALPNDGFNWDPAGAWGWSGYGPNTPPGVDKMFEKMSSNYHAPSKSILVFSPRSTGGVIRRLTVPTTNGAYNPSGAWSWSTLRAPTPSGMVGLSQGTFNKGRMIDDMGNGQAAIVYCESTTGSTYVYKVPA